MSDRLMIEAVPCMMPAPTKTGEPGMLFNYMIVLVEERGKVTARIGAGTDAQWIAEHGAPLQLELARVYFPNLELSLDASRREYVAA
jgi:hypothetical protein